MTIQNKIYLTIGVVLMLISCDRGPKIISSPINQTSHNTQNTNKGTTGIFDVSGTDKSSLQSNTSSTSNMHTVIVDEILPTEKYVYLNVNEDGEKYWIATSKQEVEVGGKYFYRGGLLKTNFESKEYNRVFDKVYLVSKIVPVSHGEKKEKMTASVDKKENAPIYKVTFNYGDDYVKISEVVKNPKEYEGKKIKMAGQCTKLNPNIMGKNWIHLKDGTMDEYDFVITSSVAVPEGHVVQMEGIVAIDKDFGAGYKYDILLEEAVLINE